jgi:ATP synthase protein I
MSTHHSNGNSAAGSAVPVSGPTATPWLKILKTSSLGAAAATLLVVVLAFIVAGDAGALSAVLGSALVVLFFAISLLIGHVVGRRNPSGAIGAFIATYVLKVVGFGAALFIVGTPDWLETTWFFIAAVVSVVVWQIAEVFAFSRVRYQIYDDPEDGESTTAGKEAH